MTRVQVCCPLLLAVLLICVVLCLRVGRKWAPSADYMFFRNNVPDREKLLPLAMSSSGEQCCWCLTSGGLYQQCPQSHVWWCTRLARIMRLLLPMHVEKC